LSNNSQLLKSYFTKIFHKLVYSLKKVFNTNRYKNWISNLNNAALDCELKKVESRNKVMNSWDGKWIFTIPLAILGHWCVFVKKVSDKDIDSSKAINLVFGSLTLYISLILIIVIPILIYKRVISLKFALLKSESKERDIDNG